MSAEETLKDAFSSLGAVMTYSGFWMGFGYAEGELLSFLKKNPKCTAEDMEAEIKKLRGKIQPCKDMAEIEKAIR